MVTPVTNSFVYHDSFDSCHNCLHYLGLCLLENGFGLLDMSYPIVTSCSSICMNSNRDKVSGRSLVSFSRQFHSWSLVGNRRTLSSATAPISCSPRSVADYRRPIGISMADQISVAIGSSNYWGHSTCTLNRHPRYNIRISSCDTWYRNQVVIGHHSVWTVHLQSTFIRSGWCSGCFGTPYIICSYCHFAVLYISTIGNCLDVDCSTKYGYIHITHQDNLGQKYYKRLLN